VCVILLESISSHECAGICLRLKLLSIKLLMAHSSMPLTASYRYIADSCCKELGASIYEEGRFGDVLISTSGRLSSIWISVAD